MATLFEREAELGALEALLGDAAAGRGGVAVVEGPAGIGKTALLSAAVRGAPRLGMRALVARAAELERDFPFVRQLLEAPVLGAPANARAALLDGPARRSGAVLDLDGAGTEETEPSAAVHGLFWLVANLAAEQPLLLAVDDVQWADEPSLRLLTYVARRLEALPIAVVATLRSGEPLAGTLDAVLGDPAVRRVRLQPLGPDGVAALVEARLGAPADPELVDACRERTGGNPFLLAELTAELAAAPGAITAGRLSELVPERVSAAIRRRLAGLGSPARWWCSATVRSRAWWVRLPISTRTARSAPRPASSARSCWSRGRGCASVTRWCARRSPQPWIRRILDARTRGRRGCLPPRAPTRPAWRATCSPPRRGTAILGR